jgi:DNA uptake protein ComE-like DNA-binding protein
MDAADVRYPEAFMKNQILALAASFLMAAQPLLAADASYTRTQTIKSPINTASPMASMMKTFGGGDMLKALEPTTDTIMIHGNRMVTVTARGTSIMDLDKQAWIQTDTAKREYYVMTFQQMSDMMERFGKMENTPPVMNRQGASNPQVETETTVDVAEEHPGTTKNVQGFTATEHIFKATITTRAKDTSGPNAGQQAASVVHYTEEVWVLDTVPPAYQAVLDFERTAGEKAASLMSPAARAAMPQGIPNTPGAQNGMLELHRRIAELKGLHVIEVTRIGMSMDMGTGTDAAAQTSPPAAPQTTDTSQTNGSSNPAPATTQSGTSRFGGLGGALARGALGGFGSKKAAPAPAPAATPAPAAQTTPAQNQPPAANGELGFLSETTIELGNFSTQPVTTAQFDVPAGYKQVQSPIEKMLNSGK